ncbi:MAG TPA: GDP-mannose 4,6-dehydratase [Puia sp.]|nr:GDP-mannose 4,6-dehydratase [Puia sp.]
MEKYLVTGFSGFVSGHLLEYLSQLGRPVEVIGLSRHERMSYSYKNLKITTYQIDLMDASRTNEIINIVRPDYIIHLASDSSVAYSWQQPVQSFQNNTNIFLNLIESVRVARLKCRILSIGSSEEYGIVDPETVPLTEKHSLNPISPYAVARVSQELLSKIYAQGYGMDIIITRSFNHIGPGQKDSFVISSFARQIVRMENGSQSELEVGNIDIVRDFLDVRDVVRAYVELLEKGRNGEIYNICSGTGYTLKSILDKMMSIAEINLKYHINTDLIRPSDNPIIIGSNEKIMSECNWAPEIPIEKSLNDIMNYWRKEIEKQV